MSIRNVCTLQVVLSRFFLFFRQKTADELRISDWSSDVCSSDLAAADEDEKHQEQDDYHGGRPSVGSRGWTDGREGGTTLPSPAGRWPFRSKSIRNRDSRSASISRWAIAPYSTARIFSTRPSGHISPPNSSKAPARAPRLSCRSGSSLTVLVARSAS